MSRDASWRAANGVADLPSQIDSLIDATLASTNLSLWLTDKVLSDVEKERCHDVKMGRAPSLEPGAQITISYYGIVESCEKQREDEIVEVIDAVAPTILEMGGGARFDGLENDAYKMWQQFLLDQAEEGLDGWCCGEGTMPQSLDQICDLVEMSEDMDKFDLEVDMLHYLIGNSTSDGPATDGMDWFDYDHKMERCGHGIQPILQNVPVKVSAVGPKYSTVEWKYGKAYCSNYATPCPAGPFIGMEFVAGLRFNPGNVSDWAVAAATAGQTYKNRVVKSHRKECVITVK